MTTPGSIHEGGELGYVLIHAFGAVMDNPDLIALAVVGDGEAETGPLEGSWKGISFINPERDGAVLPVLHLNGAKIAGPTVLGRKDPAEVRALSSRVTGTRSSRSRASRSRATTYPESSSGGVAAQAQAYATIRAIQRAAPAASTGSRPPGTAPARAGR